ncbi:GNAT family N-acetyltransferase [Alkalihalobacillus sp. FSL R5-0424]
MIKQLNMNNSNITTTVWNIQMKSYQVEASLIGVRTFPPLQETVDNYVKSLDLFYGFYEEEELVAVISIQTQGSTLVITRLMVAPEHFRKGIATSLINYVSTLYKDQSQLTVSTAKLNAPAVQAYRRNGFTQIEERVTPERISIVTLIKKQ